MKPELVLSLCMKFMESRILLTATELDIFSLLTHPMYAREIADKTQATLPRCHDIILICNQLDTINPRPIG